MNKCGKIFVFEIHICLGYFPGKISICQKMPFENNMFAQCFLGILPETIIKV